ncbi:hypothetical protein SESBI_46067 [Sesbania bispinosa]|nr:hypothetical protein SESBI_46067 [Sesbania bispinosa]
MEVIRKVAEAIGGIIQAPRYKDFGLDIMKDVGAWEISDLKWPSTGARSNNSAVWVLSWLDMDYAFQPNITPVNENCYAIVVVYPQFSFSDSDTEGPQLLSNFSAA